MTGDSVDGSFYRAILEIHKNAFEKARGFIDNTRALLDTKLTALIGLAYNFYFVTFINLERVMTVPTM